MTDNTDYMMRPPEPFARHLRGHGVISARGRDVLDLFHRLSTNDIADLRPGRIAETIFTTEKGRIIDAALVLPRPDCVLLLVSRGMSRPVLAWLERFTIMEDARYEDVSDAWTQIEWNGAGAEAAAAGIAGIHGIDTGAAADAECDGVSCIVARHESVQGPGVRMLVPADRSTQLLHRLQPVDGGDAPARSDAYTVWRVRNGYPAAGYELTGRVHPLESGAGAAVSFTKGCYIGQEVIARLENYHKVQRQLRRLRFDGLVPETAEPGAPLFDGDADAGFVTTIADDPDTGASIGLGCVRVAHGQPGARLEMRSGDAVCPVTVDG